MMGTIIIENVGDSIQIKRQSITWLLTQYTVMHLEIKARLI